MSQAHAPAYRSPAIQEAYVYVSAFMWLAASTFAAYTLQEQSGALGAFGATSAVEPSPALDHAIAAIEAASAIQLLAMLLLGVALITWHARVFDNVVAFGRPTIYSRSKSLWSWFIPFASLAWPLYSLRDAWHRSAVDDQGPRPGLEKAPVAMTLWWTAWLLFAFSNSASLNQVITGSKNPALIGGASGVLGSQALGLIACVLMLRVVHSFRPRQDACAAALFGPTATAVRGARGVGD